MMSNGGSRASLCCHSISQRGQQGNTSGIHGNTAGNTAATQATESPSLLELARNRLGNTRATQAEKGRQHKAHETPPCVATLSYDFKLVSTWWQWSPEDVEHFRSWAKSNRDAAAEWLAAEAVTVRHYRDQLHVANVGEFIKPT